MNLLVKWYHWINNTNRILQERKKIKNLGCFFAINLEISIHCEYTIKMKKPEVVTVQL